MDPEAPWECLFHDARKTVSQYKNTLVPYLLNAAKSLIPSLWRTQEPPNMKVWVAMVEWVRSIEETIHTTDDSLETYQNIWGK